MSTTVEPMVCDRYIVSVLRGSAGLMALLPGGLHRAVAPEGTPFPYATYQGLTPMRDALAGFGAIKLFSSGIYAVTCYCQGSSAAPVEAASTQIYALLHIGPGNAPVVMPGGSVLTCYRENIYALNGEDKGVAWSALRQQFLLNAIAS